MNFFTHMHEPCTTYMYVSRCVYVYIWIMSLIYASHVRQNYAYESCHTHVGDFRVVSVCRSTLVCCRNLCKETHAVLDPDQVNVVKWNSTHSKSHGNLCKETHILLDPDKLSVVNLLSFSRVNPHTESSIPNQLLVWLGPRNPVPCWASLELICTPRARFYQTSYWFDWDREIQSHICWVSLEVMRKLGARVLELWVCLSTKQQNKGLVLSGPSNPVPNFLRQAQTRTIDKHDPDIVTSWLGLGFRV